MVQLRLQLNQSLSTMLRTVLKENHKSLDEYLSHIKFSTRWWSVRLLDYLLFKLYTSLILSHH